MTNDKILIVDDSEANLAVLESYLITLGFSPQKAGDGPEALKKVAGFFPDLILLDLMMPGIDGFEVTRRLKSDPKTFKIPIVAITALQDRESNIKAIEAGVDGFLTKPIDEVMLKAHIDSLLMMRHLRSKLDDSLNRLDSIGEYHRRLAPGRSRTREIIGRSSLIEKARARINMFKNLELPVLISGESGTGKQLAAEAMHWEGRRASEPFVQINCAGLQESLLESELFGYAKGAFTGADGHKKGLIEVAERGTLFVDEIGDMTGAVQAKVLTVLDSGLFRRLGETKERKANVRIIAATNHCLEREIKKGRFRLDLFYRLNVLSIDMPPLKKGKEDIPMIVDYFLSHSSLTKSTEKTFSAQAIEAFQKYDWPGNVRELCNVVERAILFSRQDNEIALRHLPPELIRQNGAASNLSIVHSSSNDDYQPCGMMTLRELEAAYIKEALKKEEGNRTRAAKILGISRSTLKKKIADWGLTE